MGLGWLIAARVRGTVGDGLFSHGYIASDARGAVRSVRRGDVSDAAMLDAVLELDVWGKERVEGGRRG